MNYKLLNAYIINANYCQRLTLTFQINECFGLLTFHIKVSE